MRLALLAPALIPSLVALAPTSVMAVDYLSAEQAQSLMFPQADNFDIRDITLTTAQLQQFDAAAVKSHPARWQVRVARRDTSPLGYVVVDHVLGKFELITYAVAVGLDGSIRQVEVLSYRESHGHEIRLSAWRKQFVGKTRAAPLRVGEDIANISGATLSCTHVTDGVRRIMALIDTLRHSAAL